MTGKFTNTGEAQNMSSKQKNTKQRSQKCAQLVNAHKHLANHIMYVSHKSQ